MDIILIPGLWLDGAAWSDVLPGLRAAGHHPITVTLPGQGDGETGTLDQQFATVLAAVDSAQGDVLVVGHSAASTLAWMAADRRPERVHSVVMVGGFPAADGTSYADFFPVKDGVVHFPGWEAFEEADVGDLDDDARTRMLTHIHPVPATITQAPVHYTGDCRKQVPLVMVCPEYSAEDAQAWLRAGEMPELLDVEHISFVDIDTGHWPMFSAPDALARSIAAVLE
ncbi:MAG: alpha/beta hydrolase [Propionibacterium sp.]|nr:alpha/beta hydrolase [Propionibacterium sp.]